MANGKIRGVTIEIGADVSGLQKSLSSVNSEISSTQKQLKDVEKLLKLDPTNTELLAQKQKLLNQATEEYKQKLETLKSEQKKFSDAAASGNAQAQASYDALQREIISTEDYLKKAEKASEEFNTTLAKASAELTKVGNAAQTVADKTKALSVAGAAVAGAIGTMAYKAMTASDDLNTLAKQSGLTTEEIQRFQYAADVIDVSTDDIISALKKMRKNMDSTSTDTQEAWAELGVSVKSANGEFRDSTEVFYDTIEALSKVQNETERDILSMQLFGKNADSLAGIIDDGGKSLKEFADQAKIWSQESIDAANEVNDIIDELKANIGQELLITGAKALEAFRPVIETIADALTKLLDLIGNLSPEVLGIITVVALFVASISPIAGLIAKISLALAGLPAIIGAVTAAAPWIALVAAVVTLGVALYNIVKEIIENWDKIKKAFKDGIDYIKAKFIDPIKNYFAELKQKWDDFWQMISDRAKENINKIIGWVNSGIEAINNLIQKLNDSALGKAVNLNIGTIGTIPALANGGSVKNGGAALVGEAGAELLTVNGGMATVTPLTNNTTTYNTYNQTATNPIEVTLMLDKTVLARQMVQANAKAVMLAGGSCIK